MSATVPLPDLQRLASRLERAVELSALRLADPIAQRRAFRAQVRLREVIVELGAAIALDAAPAAFAHPDDAVLVGVISPGADRADELVRSIPEDVMAMCERAAASRLGIPDNAAGGRIVGEVMRRNGWRQDDLGWRLWRRPGHGAAADVAAEQPR